MGGRKLQAAFTALCQAETDDERQDLARHVVRAHTLTRPSMGVFLQHEDREMRLLAVRAMPLLTPHLGPGGTAGWVAPFAAAARRPPSEVVWALQPLAGDEGGGAVPFLMALAVEQAFAGAAHGRARRLVADVMRVVVAAGAEVQDLELEDALPHLLNALLTHTPESLSVEALARRHGSIGAAASRLLRQAERAGQEALLVAHLDAAVAELATGSGEGLDAGSGPPGLGTLLVRVLVNGYRASMLAALAVTRRVLLAHETARPVLDVICQAPGELCALFDATGDAATGDAATGDAATGDAGAPA